MTILSLKNYSRPALGSGRKFKRSAASSGPICQETFTLLQEGVVVLNQQGIILSYNPAFAAMTGVPLNLDLRGQSITRFLPGEFSGEFHALVELLAYAEEPIATSDFDLVTYHGVDRPVRMSIARMQSADYTHLTFLSLDENLKMQDEINR
ncbi:MAG: PAS domain S-box protein, partial [Anaerolineae bacterium]|nr:PAS domain S-box protein [Anaerolineae bacterium]